jgi:hypothetical protein
MNQQAVAIIIVGALIAGAIALTNHWAFTSHGEGAIGFLLNRWTGTVYFCTPLPSFEMSCPPVVAR